MQEFNPHMSLMNQHSQATAAQAASANPFIAGAISNALYRLTGKRIRHLPFTPERVLETLKT